MSAPSSPPKILMVCYGNLCRSPMAEGLMRARLEPAYEVASAGTHAFPGQTPTRLAQLVMLEEEGIDIGACRSETVSAEMLAETDWVFTMSRAQADAVARMDPAAAARTFLFGAFAPEPARGDSADPGGAPLVDVEVPDPMGHDHAEYLRCQQRLARCADACAAWLRAGAPRDTRGSVAVSDEHAESER